MKKLLLTLSIVGSLFAFNSISTQNTENNYDVEGKVIKAYTQRGYGRMGSEWLFMDIKAKDGKIYKIAIAPTFRISNLPIKEGDIVKVDGWTPPMFEAGVLKAIDIYDETQKRDYPINDGPYYGYGNNTYTYGHHPYGPYGGHYGPCHHCW